MNAIRAIHPYRHEGLWVFDDEAVGLRQEPFVSGADGILVWMGDPEFRGHDTGPAIEALLCVIGRVAWQSGGCANSTDKADRFGCGVFPT